MNHKNKGLSKEIIVLGDVEMGAGNLTDDFISDKTLSSLIVGLAEKPHPIDLIFNGDTFDFLKCPSQLKPRTKYPRQVTQKISLQKMRLIAKAHAPVFQAMKAFAQKEGKCLYFTLGNHDHELIQKRVQHELQKILGNSKQVVFSGLYYRKHGIYVEHGQQYDALFKIYPDQIFLRYRKKQILNYPLISLGMLGSFMQMKEKYPFLERVFPKSHVFSQHPVAGRKFRAQAARHFFKFLAQYPLYHRHKAVPATELFRNIYSRLRTMRFDPENITAKFQQESSVQESLVILGHIHEKIMSTSKKQLIIHPGSWRDEYDFNPQTRELVPRSKRYVQIQIIDGKPHHSLIDIPGRETAFTFDEVIHHEIDFIRLAAQQEGFSPKIQ